MWLTDPNVLIVTIFVVAAFVRGAFGFGDGLVAMPLLVLLLPITAAAPLMAFAGCLMAVIILAQEWRKVDVRPVFLLMVAGMLGVPIGIWMARQVDDRIVKAVLGTFIVSFSVWSLWKPNILHLTTDRSAPLFGIFGGILGGAYNTGGPPVVVYATLRRWSPQQFRGTMQVCTLTGSLWIIANHMFAGNITRNTLTMLGTIAPFIVVSLLVGRRLTSKLATPRFIGWIYGFLILLGIGLLASCFAPPR